MYKRQQLQRPIENRSASGSTFRRDRWTSRLGLERANEAAEIILETEPEWRLYDALKNGGLSTVISSGSRGIALQDSESPKGRAWLVANKCRIRFDGANGFLVQSPGDKHYFRDIARLVDFVKSKPAF